jgi:hypothetical protein
MGRGNPSDGLALPGMQNGNRIGDNGRDEQESEQG